MTMSGHVKVIKSNSRRAVIFFFTLESCFIYNTWVLIQILFTNQVL